MPIVNIARAAAPMLPGWLGATRTMRMRERRSAVRHAVTIPLSLFAHGRMAKPAPAAAQPDLMHPTLSIAVKAARRAGNVINRGARDLDLLTVTSKGPKDFVSEIDREAERQIVETLLTAYPDHAILAEEGTAKGANADAENVWIIDPLDGTTNFLHGFPQYCVSIALAHRGQVTQGVIYDPCRNDLFTATRGRGAFLNDRRIRVSRRTHLRDCLIGTGFPFRDGSYLDTYLKMMKTMIESTAGLRRPGAAALDLAYVAAGFYDGFWEVGLNPWDVAAGSLLDPGSGRPDRRSVGRRRFSARRAGHRRQSQDLRANGHRACPVPRGNRAPARPESRRSRRMSGAGWVLGFLAHAPRAGSTRCLHAGGIRLPWRSRAGRIRAI